MHGALSLHQLAYARPAPGYSSHRTPMQNLYICGNDQKRKWNEELNNKGEKEKRKRREKEKETEKEPKKDNEEKK